MDFILKLCPVIYNFQTGKYDAFIKGNLPGIRQNYTEAENIRQSGFIAQEVEIAAKESGYDFNGVIVPRSKNETYGIAYSQFVVPLVKAVQEQQVVINAQAKINSDLLQQLHDLQKEMMLIKEKMK